MSGLAAYLLYFKALHIVFVVTWFAGLFYLPRLFVYHAATTDAISIERFKVMERRLYLMMNIGASLAILFGVLMLVAVPSYLQLGWLHAKLSLVAILLAYHLWCRHLVKMFAQNRNTHSQRWYRWFNEAPSVLLIAIVLLAVVKPF
ncbi:MAG: CopD family protein [Steroidobacteraceae bacterium]